MSRFDTYLGSGGAVRYDFGKIRKIYYYARFLFIYFEQTVVQMFKKFHLDVKILNVILNYNVIYIYIYTQSAVNIYTQGINT